MKNVIFTLLFLFLTGNFLLAQNEEGTLMTLNVDDIQRVMSQVPEVGTSSANSKLMVLPLPLPDGTDIDFIVKHDPLVSKDSPLYKTSAGKTYSLYGVDKAGYNGTMVLYEDGIHATLNTPDGLLFISKTSAEFVHEYVYFADTKGFPHSPDDAEIPNLAGLVLDNTPTGGEHQHGINEPTHSHEQPSLGRNSLANNNFFSVGGSNTRPQLDLFIMTESIFRNKYANEAAAEARIVEIVNGVKAIFQQDLNLTINYLGTYYNASATSPSTSGAQSLYNALSDANVPSGTKADVDLGHLIAGLASVPGGYSGHGAGSIAAACVHDLPAGGAGFTGLKASGYSAFSDPNQASFIPLVAHELGHQLGGFHTWSGSAGNCSASQFGGQSAIEVGSGVTMSSYAGICGADDVPDPGSKDYNHTEAIREMYTLATTYNFKSFSGNPGLNGIPDFPQNYTNATGPTECITTISHPNAVPQANSNPVVTNLNIPARTPFELTGSATDGDGDNLTYQWDQMDFALSQQPIDGFVDKTDGPLFRTFAATASPTRIFPQLSDILSNTQTKGEILPEVSRRMRFALTVRDGRGGVGIDTVSFNVIDGGAGFAITEPVSIGSGTITVNWNIANTTSPPISCANVDIMLSTDGGQTFTSIACNTANDGSETINLPSNAATSQGRIKIKCSSGVFFDMNNANLTLTAGSGLACGGGGSTGMGEGTCLAGDIVEPSEIPASTGTYIYRSSSTLTTSGAVEINSGFDVSFLAGTSITLNAGFHAKVGSIFLAKIEACAALKEEEIATTEKITLDNTILTEEDKNLSSEGNTSLNIAPNPFTGITNIDYELSNNSSVSVQIFDMNGKLVRSIINRQTQNAGFHQLTFDGSNLKAGMFYIMLQTENERVTKKMILVK